MEVYVSEELIHHGVTKAEMAEILTHVAFYAGWPSAWAAFRMAVEVYEDDPGVDGGMFGLGSPTMPMPNISPVSPI